MATKNILVCGVGKKNGPGREQKREENSNQKGGKTSGRKDGSSAAA
jgi:hypothetical protein